MTIGFLYIPGGQAEKIRIDNIRNYLKNKKEIKNIPINFDNFKNKNNFIISNFKIDKIIKKIFLREKYNMFKEIDFSNTLKNLNKSMLKIYHNLLNELKDITIFHAETQCPAYICSKIKKRKGIPYIFDMHGLAVAEAIGASRTISSIEFNRKIEYDAVKNADKIIVVSNFMKDYLIEKYRVDKNKVIVIPNGANIFEKKCEYSDSLNIIYGGAFIYYDSIIDYLKTIKILNEKRKNYNFYLMGDGPCRNELFDYINKEYLDINYLGKKEREKSLNIFSKMQIGMAQSTDDLARKTASPVKIYDYASCGMPIVTNDVGEWSEDIKKYDCGIVTEKKDPKQFVKAIEDLSDFDTWNEKSNNCIKLIREKYQWKNVMKPLNDIYR